MIPLETPFRGRPFQGKIPAMLRQLAAVVAVVACCAAGPAPSAQVRLADESDRAAFRAWFVLLADAQFERQTD